MAGKLLDSSFGFLRPATAFLSAVVLLSGCAANRGPTGGVAQQPAAITVAGAPNTIPERTILEVRTSEPIISTNAEGRTYQGSIATEVVDTQKNVLLPRGSQVELVILEVKEKSGVKGASLQLGLRSVTVEGKTYLVVSEEVTRSTGLGANRGTAEKVGGGAALGTLIGAVAGGGTGAAIGGLVGAAAGAAVQVLTQGKEVRVPAESVLRFELDEPVRLEPR